MDLGGLERGKAGMKGELQPDMISSGLQPLGRGVNGLSQSDRTKDMVNRSGWGYQAGRKRVIRPDDPVRA